MKLWCYLFCSRICSSRQDPVRPSVEPSNVRNVRRSEGAFGSQTSFPSVTPPFHTLPRSPERPLAQCQVKPMPKIAAPPSPQGDENDPFIKTDFSLAHNDDFVPIPLDKPSGLAIDDFLPVIIILIIATPNLYSWKLNTNSGWQTALFGWLTNYANQLDNQGHKNSLKWLSWSYSRKSHR